VDDLVPRPVRPGCPRCRAGLVREPGVLLPHPAIRDRVPTPARTERSVAGRQSRLTLGMGRVIVSRAPRK
jgi:hypothetical protein